MLTPAEFKLRVETEGCLVLDGGLATELESRGCVLDTSLWSAAVLDSAPDLIEDVHAAFLAAGAECVTTASYQASVGGFESRGLSASRARELIGDAVRLARRACERSLAERGKAADALPPLVAASVGPYGACLADGSEYRGDYEAGESELIEFHRPRWDLLVESGPDLIACETVPSAVECGALAKIIDAYEAACAWVSFCCRDGSRISDGTPIGECVRRLAGLDGLCAVGVNCTSPEHVPSLIDEIGAAEPGVPIVVYPNSGERYDTATRSWRGTASPVEFGSAAREWMSRGATVIGGCCRTTPEHIAEISSAVRPTRE